jgi:hypothetical protein
MSGKQSGGVWKSILGLCDETEALLTRENEGGGPSNATFRTEVRRRRAEIRGLLEKELHGGTLTELGEGRHLTIDEAEVLVVLLRRYVDPRSPWLAGREILERIAEDSFSKLKAITLLRPDGALRATGLLAVQRPTSGQGHDPLDVKFRLSDAAAALFYSASPAKATRKAPRKPRPYASNREYLLDLRDLAEYCRRRAHAIFGPPDAEGARPSREERRHIERKIRSLARHVEQDLIATEERDSFPFVAFQREFHLSAEESLIVIDLTFAELFEGETSLEMIELLQMVSRDEEDILRKRRLFAGDSVLTGRGIVAAVESEDDKPSTGRVMLAPWVKDRILGDDVSGRAIAPDEKIDFHLYLRELDSSARFYRDLVDGEDSESKGS